jgi:hypothetical protein
MNRTERAEREKARLMHVRTMVRLLLALGIAASLAANVMASEPTIAGRAIAAWSPVALLATVELLSRVPVAPGWPSRVRVASAGVIAAIAAWVSYWHMVAVTIEHGEQAVAAHLLPFSVDGLVVVASVSLVELSARIKGDPIITPRPALPSARTGYGPAVAALATKRPELSAAQIATQVGCSVKTARQHLARHRATAGTPVAALAAG